MQSAEVWSPGLPRVARADPALTKLPASSSSSTPPSVAAPSGVCSGQAMISYQSLTECQHAIRLGTSKG